MWKKEFQEKKKQAQNMLSRDSIPQHRFLQIRNTEGWG